MTAGDFFRGLGLWISNMLLVFMIAISIATFMGVEATSQSFLKPLFSEIMMQQVASQLNMEDLASGLNQQCASEKKEIMILPINMSMISLDISINCTKMKQDEKNETLSIFREQVTGKVFDSFYNKKVCEGSQCFDMLKSLPQTLQSNPQNALAFISADFNRYMKAKLIFLIIGAAVFAALVFLLAKGWPGKFISLGGTLLTSGLPYFAIPLLKKNILAMAPPAVVPIINSLIGSLLSIFMYLFIGGAVLLAVGIGLKIYFKRKEGKKKRK